MKRKGMLITLCIMGIVYFLGCTAQDATPRIKKGSRVAFQYILSVRGHVFDTTVGREPFEYVHGEGGIVKGLERQLEGLTVGDERRIIVSADEGYGQIDPKAFREVPKSIAAPGVDLKPGNMIALQANDGHKVPAMIAQVRENTLVLSLNHPLAGRELQYDVKIISVK